MTFLKAIETCFIKYADFNGRASRPEFWWFYLFNILCWIVAFAINPVIEIVVGLGLLLPYIAVAARRLHDINKSGWWQLIELTIIGILLIIIWNATEGEKKKNKYGRPIKIKS